MRRKELIKTLKKICSEECSNATKAHIKIGGPYLKAKYVSKYRVTATVIFRPWPVKHPKAGYSSTYLFDCKTLNGARTAMDEVCAALPVRCHVTSEGWYEASTGG